MFIPVPAIIAVALLIAVLIILLARRAGGGRGDLIAPPRMPPAPPSAAISNRMVTNGHANDADIRALIAAGRKIEAIKLVRERTGLGLKEAKDAVEAMERGQ